jgi:hypothetical protein
MVKDLLNWAPKIKLWNHTNKTHFPVLAKNFRRPWMKLKIFFCQFPNPWTHRVSGMGGYTSKCEKSQNHCTLLCSVICTVYTLHMLRDCPIFWISLEITNSVVFKWFSIGPVTDGLYCVWYHLGLETFQDPTKIFKVWLLFVDLRVDILGSLLFFKHTY